MKLIELKTVDIEGNQPESDDKSKQKVDYHYIHLITCRTHVVVINPIVIRSIFYNLQQKEGNTIENTRFKEELNTYVFDPGCMFRMY